MEAAKFRSGLEAAVGITPELQVSGMRPSNPGGCSRAVDISSEAREASGERSNLSGTPVPTAVVANLLRPKRWLKLSAAGIEVVIFVIGAEVGEAVKPVVVVDAEGGE